MNKYGISGYFRPDPDEIAKKAAETAATMADPFASQRKQYQGSFCESVTQCIHY
jgi:hypothetical protein